MSKSGSEIQALTDALVDTKKELSKAYSSLEAVSRMAKIIHSTLGASQLSELVMDIIESLMGFEAFSLLVFDSESGFLFKGKRNLPPDVFQNLVEKVEESRHAWTKKPGESHLIKESTYGLEMRCFLLESSDKIEGAFCASRKTVELLTSEDIRILSLIATQISTAYQNSILYDLARKLSITDEQTKVYNQCYLRSQLETETRRAQRYNRPLSLLMVGFNNSKSISEQFDQTQTDIVLCRAASIIQKTFRCVDLVARYDEEEFAVVLPETPVEGAKKAAERLKRAFRDHWFLDDQGKRVKKLTLSIGISSFRDGVDHKELIQEAVKSLHQVRSSGKNKVIL